MAGGIPEAYVGEVLARTDIVELIGARVPLRRSGAEFSARCPFHEERTPSFTVSPAKQFYHCFGCGAHGSAIGFLMAYDRLSFPEAVRELAGRAGLPPPESGGSAPHSRPDDALHPLLERAAVWFRAQLRRHDAAAEAVSYLKGRGLSGEIAQRFGIGFAPPGGRALLEAFAEHSPRLLARAGLIVERNGQWLDKFRHRVMFPIRDERGRVVGFGGRALGEARPKYLNSPETPLFQKGRLLYNLDAVLKLRPAPPTLWVVEGYMDVVALAQYGFDHVVATLGTAATSEHLRRAFRASNEVVFCFDGDAAGQRAAERALDTALPELHDGRQLRFMYLPAGDDPDSFVRRAGAPAMQALAAQARPLSDELFTRLDQAVDIRSAEGRARAVELARPRLARLPQGGVYRTLLTQRLAQFTGLDEHTVNRRLESDPAGRRPQTGRSAAPKQPLMLADRLAAVLLAHPALLDELQAVLASLPEDPETGFLRRLCAALRDSGPLGLGGVIERWRDADDGIRLGGILAGSPPALDPSAARNELLDGASRLGTSARHQVWRQAQATLRGRRPGDLSEEERRALQAGPGARHRDRT